MVAVFGYVIAVAAGGPEESNLPACDDEVRLYGEHDVTGSEVQNRGAVVPADASALSPLSWQHGSPEANALSTGGSNAGERRRSAIVWKPRAAISNIRFAKSTLAQYSQVWPVCAMYQPRWRRAATPSIRPAQRTCRSHARATLLGVENLAREDARGTWRCLIAYTPCTAGIILHWKTVPCFAPDSPPVSPYQ